MSVESWKAFFDVGTVVLLFLTFAFGFGVLFTGNIVNTRQAEEIRRQDLQIAQLQAIAAPRDLTESQTRDLIAACQPFSGRTVHVRSQVMDLGGGDLRNRLSGIFGRPD